jgi:ComF family protein
VFDLPTQCAFCRGWSASRLCADCSARHAAPRWRSGGGAIGVADGVARCGACVVAPLPFAHAVAAVDYRFPWSGMVTALKFHAALDLAGAMADLLAHAATVQRAPHDALPVLLLPVPLGRERLAERGMNQAWELARRTARRLGVTARGDLLVRRIETPHLADLPRDERARAIRGAFALERGATTALRGQRVALVDDVMTTGATAAEAARTLLAGGAAAVELWVFAHTP